MFLSAMTRDVLAKGSCPPSFLSVSLCAGMSHKYEYKYKYTK